MRFYIFFALFSTIMAAAINCSAQGFDVLAEIDGNKDLSSLSEVCPSELVKSESLQFFNKTKFCSTNHETCLILCTQGSSDHCFGLANHFNRNDVDEHYTRKLYSKSCHLGLASACTNAAAGIRKTDGKEAVKCTTETFKRTCGVKDPWGCTMYAFALVDGEGVEKNNELALQALKGSCCFGDSDRACSEAKLLIEEISKADSGQKEK